ncbi:hypothetical protein LUZ63_015880 [Rhynchospora breviuscula]|uniref:Uncharacterized protein n=1 Tax=Rhynchospora breviuscula TaxID=2022672 RepID=A0A9Q0HN81_9POAL|nr:hypothetical protein LUZ63_015880 [Rhynchospora breviuscula]
MSLSSNDSVDTPETASMLRVDKVTGSHMFKIMGYSLQSGIEKRKFLESATFNVGGYDWLIRYYPNGQKKSEEDYTSIFVVLKSKEEHVKAQISFIMLNQNRNPLSERHTTKLQIFSAYNQNHSFGYPNFVKRSNFESVLEDDCLIVSCTVSVFKDFPVEPDFPLLVPPPLALQQLSHLLETGYGADVTFQVEEETFNAHKCILAMRSQVFQAQFFGQLKEKPGTVIKIGDMEAHVFKSLLHFIYSETIPQFQEINESEKIHLAQHLLVAADRYDLERLKIICENILYGSIDMSNAVDLLSFADMHNCIHLKRACLKYLASPEILEDVVATKKLKVAP